MKILIETLWFLSLVVGLNIVYFMRNRAGWARRTANVIRRFGLRDEDATILVWVIAADFIVVLGVVAYFLRGIT
jgi:hypothetical protein